MSDPYLEPPKIAQVWVGVSPYSIGKHSYVSEFSHVSQNVTIGNFCSIANLCTIGAQQHPVHFLTTFPFEEILAETAKKPTLIGSDVWIGCNSVIMEGVNVGHGAVIGAGAVVTKDVPPYAIVVGTPAKVIRYRFHVELIVGLLETRWWDQTAEVIRTLPIRDPESTVSVLRSLTKT